MKNSGLESIWLLVCRNSSMLAWQPSVPEPAREAASPWIIVVLVLIMLGGFALVCFLGYRFISRPIQRAQEHRRANRDRTLEQMGFKPFEWTQTTAKQLKDAFENFKYVPARMESWEENQTEPENAQIQTEDGRQILVFDLFFDSREEGCPSRESTFVWIIDRSCRFPPLTVWGYGEWTLMSVLRPLEKLFNFSHPHPSLRYSCRIADERHRLLRRPLGANLLACLESYKPTKKRPIHLNLGFDFFLNGDQFLLESHQLVPADELTDFVCKAETIHAAATCDGGQE